MKVDSVVTKSFNPITISITLETEEELNALYVMFNHCYITEAPGMESIDTTAVRESIKKELGHTPDYKGQFNKLDMFFKEKNI